MPSAVDQMLNFKPPPSSYQRHGGLLVWSDIMLAVAYMAHVMRHSNYTPKQIIAVGRGGYIPSVMLSHMTGAELYPIRVKSYKDTTQMGVSVALESLKAIEQLRDLQDTLVVDDLWDSGYTMRLLQNLFPAEPRTLFGTLFYKAESEQQKPPLNFPGLWMPKDQWITFPWELKPHG